MFGLFYSVTDIAAIFDVNWASVYPWIELGELGAFNYRRSDVQKLLWQIRAIDLFRFAKSRAHNLPEQLRDTKNDPFAGMDLKWDENLLTNVLVPVDQLNKGNSQ